MGRHLLRTCEVHNSIHIAHTQSSGRESSRKSSSHGGIMGDSS